MSALRMFMPITKVDAAQRLVYGVATAEIEDRAGEVCDYASTKPLYERWSQEIARSTGGKSFGNLRAMHGLVAAGKVIEISFNDEDRRIEICAKVVDDAEWRKVSEGVYTGFSQGGAYIDRWTDEAGRTRYTADPTEISLVDLPCLQEARFEMIKLDGSREVRRFGQSGGPMEDAKQLISELASIELLLAPESAGGEASEKLREILARTVSLLSVLAQATPDEAPGAAEPDEARGRESSAKKSLGGRAAVWPAERPAWNEKDATSALREKAEARLEKKLDDLAGMYRDLRERIVRMEAQPMPLPFKGYARAVSKHEDGGNDVEATDRLLADPTALSVLAIKLAQRKAATHSR